MSQSRLNLPELGTALRTRRLTASQIVSVLIACKHRWEHLNSIVACDEPAVRAAARRRDQELDEQHDRGPLHGIPFIAKDNIDTVDLPTSACTPALRCHRPGRDAPVIARLRDAGAILFGKANMHELAFGITNNRGAFGAARNPYDPDCIPGGSSGGTAAAVAAGIVPFGLGSDTGGSVRLPAALCGIVGLRPTVGRYPGGGVVPISPTRDTVGPMARTVADTAVVDSVITGEEGRLETIDLATLRLGVPRGYFYENLEPAVAAAMEHFLATLRAHGVTLVEADIARVRELDQAVSFIVALYEARPALQHYLQASGAAVGFEELVAQIASPDVRAPYQSMMDGKPVADEQYAHAIQRARPALQRAIADYLRGHRLDGYVVPTTCMTARPIGEDETVELNGARVPVFLTYTLNCDPASNAGNPSISIPVGLAANGLPVGAMIESGRHTDRRLLAVARALETLCAPLPAPQIQPA
ncbi:MAG: indoleacetamide hydrolase [Gammaproteobacteria bacterium]|nr:indoleacetamide hydrolase [Gammaproteobacteria bacterium]